MQEWLEVMPTLFIRNTAMPKDKKPYKAFFLAEHQYQPSGIYNHIIDSNILLIMARVK